LRENDENGNSSSCQPLKSSTNSTEKRSASSVVEPGLRFSRMSMKTVVPLFRP
jgi:hypothetical protein